MSRWGDLGEKMICAELGRGGEGVNVERPCDQLNECPYV